MARIRPVQTIARVKTHQNRTYIPIPNPLCPMQKTRYPADNALTFERWFYNTWDVNDQVERHYLGIQWTALYCNNNYGGNAIVNTIQKFIDSLDKTKKYYTIVQYDDGILNKIDSLDIKVLAMAGPRIDYPLPLLCQPHKFQFPQIKERDIFASFMGSFTHSIRGEMFRQLEGKEGYYVTTKPHSLKDYCEILARSKYALCPRGYGQSSFRICEAIEMGAIPVYISDEFVLPYDLHFDYGVMLMPGDDIDMLLKENDSLRQGMKMESINKHLFTYEGCKKEILNYLKNEKENEQSNDNNQNE